MRGRILKYFSFSELNENYVPGTVLRSLDDEKTLSRRLSVPCYIKIAQGLSFSPF